MEPNTKAGLKQRAIEELRLFWIIALYLWVFLGSFTVYRRLVIAETGVAYLHYGIALIEALVIAKVILIGRMFGIRVLLFGVAERLVEAWFRKQGLVGGLREVGELGGYELGARVLMLIVA